MVFFEKNAINFLSFKDRARRELLACLDACPGTKVSASITCSISCIVYSKVLPFLRIKWKILEAETVWAVYDWLLDWWCFHSFSVVPRLNWFCLILFLFPSLNINLFLRLWCGMTILSDPSAWWRSIPFCKNIKWRGCLPWANPIFRRIWNLLAWFFWFEQSWKLLKS